MQFSCLMRQNKVTFWHHENLFIYLFIHSLLFFIIYYFNFCYTLIIYVYYIYVLYFLKEIVPSYVVMNNSINFLDDKLCVTFL
jgi:hypothetical protein